MASTIISNAEIIWVFLKSKGFNDYACAAIIGNMDIESKLNPKNLQDSYQAKLGHTDNSYVSAIDSGAYSKEQFSNDSAGYGLVQWTYHTRKRALYEFIKGRGSSIGDINAQLDFFYKELSECFPLVLNLLTNSLSIKEASDTFMEKYESPTDQSASAKNIRVSAAQIYYSRFASRQDKEVDRPMGYKYFTKGQAFKVSDHFYSTEFDCHGSGCCTQTIVNEKLIQYLEKIREHFNAPITITSPYRCQTHNSRIGGAAGSRHSKGDAADIVVKGFAPRTVAQYAESIGILGIGLYETASDGYFVHIDTRDYRSFWYGQNEEGRTTFGAYSGNTSVQNRVNTGVLDTILNLGDRGQAVKTMQEKLIKLGISCGSAGADGDFGRATFDAVKMFQKMVGGLGVDGIAGNQTLTALDKAVAALSSGDGSSKYVKITANILNVRSGPGIDHPIISSVRKDAVYALVEEKTGWGKINNPNGWISSQYYEVV